MSKALGIGMTCGLRQTLWIARAYVSDSRVL